MEGSATLRSAGKVAGGATILRAANLDEARAMFSGGQGDALALGRLALEDLARRIPGTRIAQGNFHVAETAVAVPKGNPQALRAASELVCRMKAEGTVAASFARHNMADAVIPA